MNPLLIFGIGGGIALLLLIIGVVVTLTSESNVVEKRLGQIVDTQDAAGQKRPKEAQTPLTEEI